MKTPLFNIHDLILVLTLAVCLLLVFFQLLLSKQKVTASQFLSGFFIFIGIGALCTLLIWNDYIHLQTTLIKQLLAFCLLSSIVGKSVCLYFYVLSTTRSNFHLNKLHAFHLLHFLIIFLAIAKGISSDQLRFSPGSHTADSILLTNKLWHYLKLLPVAYAFAATLEIRRYKLQLQNFYSSFSLEGPFWLMLLTLGFALNWLWSLVAHLLGQNIQPAIADTFGILDNYLTFFLINALFVFSLIYAHKLLETRDKPKEKDVVSQQISALDIQSIRDAMEHHQLYLKPNLTIEDFASQVGIHYREVSSIINKQFNSNFFEFVNEYRVNKARQMLSNPEYSHMTILDILLESGFNSKSSFHRFFKRYTGMSAADFRKKSL